MGKNMNHPFSFNIFIYENRHRPPIDANIKSPEIIIINIYVTAIGPRPAFEKL